MELKLFQKGFNYSQDGPGNRLVYHLKGCNMRCPWCSNPEGMRTEIGQVQTVTVEDIIDEADFSRAMFFENGGVTFTGGEATLQLEALKAALKGIKEKEITTALETNGTCKEFSELLPYIDFLIMDFKHPDGKKLKEITGMDNEIIKSNILKAAESGKKLLIRIPLIGGFNTDEDAIKGFLEFFKTLSNKNVCFEVLKYHEYGKDKWQKCGFEYTVKDAFVEEKTRIDFEAKMKNIGLKVIRT